MILDEINAMDQAAFIAALGAVFEDSPWVAERAWRARPFASLDALWRAMTDAVTSADGDTRLALIRSHPDLAGRAARAGALGAHSTREQAGAGLDRLSDDEYTRFHLLNDAYLARFGFPFVVVVKDHTKDSILAAFETRLENDYDGEIAEALRNIGLIAKFRLADMIDG